MMGRIIALRLAQTMTSVVDDSFLLHFESDTSESTVLFVRLLKLNLVVTTFSIQDTTVTATS